MGVKILDEDGTVIHEFRDGLGVILLQRMLIAAKFRDDADMDLVLNGHVSELGKALAGAYRPKPLVPRSDDDDVLRQVQLRLNEALRHHVFGRSIPWMQWTDEQKRVFVRDVMFAPWVASEQFLVEYIEERDSEFMRWRAALTDVAPQ
jgi:hypothetical protein